MACIFPQAPSLQAYWENILSKVDAIDDPPRAAEEASTLPAKAQPDEFNLSVEAGADCLNW